MTSFFSLCRDIPAENSMAKHMGRINCQILPGDAYATQGQKVDIIEGCPPAPRRTFSHLKFSFTYQMPESLTMA